MIKYKVRERIFGIGDDHWIEDEHGHKAFLVDGKVLRIRETFELKDDTGRVVAVIKKKAIAVRDTMMIEDEHGAVVATVRKKLFSPIRHSYYAELRDGGELEAHGDLIGKEYRIESGGHKIAEVSRSWFRVRDHYGIRIADGADTALLLSVAVCIEQLVAEDD
ncbi:uncharacterized protein YxjI [Kitasatospora sp. MAP12-15]|uniref:LURP-one-related/scramblase family protein n=1 Tax=unclassified Kitasatospora TaxID=2633591 RepID=UPI00247EE262|nr:uncharacterized protein YxjI [Kitasatospora sp. MAP12-44]